MFCCQQDTESHDFWRVYSLFVARVANDATRDTKKLYARQKSFDYHCYQYTRPNRTNSFKLIRKNVKQRYSMKL